MQHLNRHFDVMWLNCNFFIYFVVKATKSIRFMSWFTAWKLQVQHLSTDRFSWTFPKCVNSFLITSVLVTPDKIFNTLISAAFCTSLSLTRHTCSLSAVFNSSFHSRWCSFKRVPEAHALRPLQPAPTRLLPSHHALFCSGLLTLLLQSFTFFIVTLGNLCNRPLGAIHKVRERV